MNSKKGKGKNKTNKSPNPNPQQKEEVVKTPEKEDPVVENVESEIKVEERVPEIISDIVPPVVPAEDVKNVEEPKKPKRNRGKKKKHEKEEIEKSGDIIEKVEEEVKLMPLTVEASKVEVIGDTPLEKPSELPNLTATARKKKNKNKNANVEQAIKMNENISKIEETKEDLLAEVSDSNIEVKCEMSPKTVEEEIKPAKKKNKKKKRHDSEKSDKAEEISCTSAFQQLLAVEDEKDDSKKSVSETKIEIIPEVISEIQTLPVKQDIFEENVNKENKSKKKGKKDKHNISSDIKEEVQKAVETESASIKDLLVENLDETKIIQENIPDEIKLISEDQEKNKAKIAKPVDKNRKEKSNQALKGGENIIIQEKPKPDEVFISEIKEPLQDQSKCEEICFEKKVEELKELAPTLLPESSNLPHMEKKRKKSPKPQQKQDPKKIETKETFTEETKSKTDTTDESEKTKETNITHIQEKSTIKETPEHKILETPIEVSSEPEFTKEPIPQAPTTTTNLEVKPGKKRKKSPKPMTILEITEDIKKDVKQTESTVITEPPAVPVETLPPSTEAKSEQSEQKSDQFCDLPQTDDIEISSVKADESEGSIAEIIPDIQYPRAASQQRVDDNNNTIIREVVLHSDVKLGIPVFVPDTPFIQEEGISLTSPELVASGIRIIDVEANVVKPTEEKTDIKSKMMEVNQDMEELRLSIERSLAELTCMEKAEENIEKHYESKIDEGKTDFTSKLSTQGESKAIGEESQTTESAILMIEKKPMEAIGAVPCPPPKINKKQKQKAEDVPKPSLPVIPLPPPLPKEESKPIVEDIKTTEASITSEVPPVPARKDNKGKGKSKKKGKQESEHVSTVTETTTRSTEGQSSKENVQESKQEEKKEEKSDNSQDNTKKQSDNFDDNKNSKEDIPKDEETNQNVTKFEPIESFEDAMTSSLDDVNQTFEIIANESEGSNVNPEINIIAPTEESRSDPKDVKQSPVTPPKNLLGHPVIPVRSNKMDYKKEKNKTPNTLAKVKIKDSIEIETKKQSKECQTDNIKKLMQKKSVNESLSTLDENEEFVYKYNFRKVFLPSVCHVCKKELKPMRVTCNYCHLLFYCSQKHKDEDWPQHQAFCFAVSTIVHLKGQKHIYEDAATITGHNYRLLRMQMIVSCEKILKRKLVPWEQEALLYPRVCGDDGCREWRLNKLADCDGCGQISYCSSNPDHLPKTHQRWCKSYSLYQKLVCYQQTRGRLEPKLPSRVMTGHYQVPDKINEVLAAMYEEKIDMSDVEYAALTQLATAPLSAVYSFQLYINKMNANYANGTYKKTSFTVHVVGAELQFEADALHKWEVFFLHLRPDVADLRVVLVAPDLNPSNLPLDLLGKIRLCEQCRQDKRRVLFSFQDKMIYSEYYRSDDFITPDIVCAFNPSIQRSSVFNGKDPWPSTINCILKQKVPFTITSYTLEELRRDLIRIKECADFDTISEPKYNSFASVRPDRNFISDDEIPLLFKNYCFVVITGVF